MKIVCISDTHNSLGKVDVPDGDLLIHAGDLSRNGSHYELEQELKNINKLPHQHKIFIAGNHDLLFEDYPDRASNLLNQFDLTYLQDSSVTINGIKFWGSPWTPRYYNWAFNMNREDIHEKWDLIDPDTNVLITHGPPYEILDKNIWSEHVGCRALRNTIDKELNVKFHIFGHIHESYGVGKIGERRFINASISDKNCRPTNKPVVVHYNSLND